MQQRRHIRGAIAGVLLAAGAMALALPVTAQERLRIAILPIVVHSGEDPQYLRAGLADMLASRLEQVGDFEVIRVEDLRAATTSIDTAIERGKKLGVDFVLFGSFTRFGNGASLDMQCVATAEQPDQVPLREIFVHSGSIGELIPDLQELVGKVSRFTIRDFEALRASSSPPAAGGSPATGTVGAVSDDELEMLRGRIDALEAAVQRLESAAEQVE